MYPSKKAQIGHLKADEALTNVPNKHADFADIFLPKLAVELPEYTRINNHAIKFVDNWQSPYGPNYSLGPVKLEPLKVYIENNLVNDFIRPSKFLITVLIFFDRKPDRSLRLCIDYQGLNNLKI